MPVRSSPRRPLLSDKHDQKRPKRQQMLAMLGKGNKFELPPGAWRLEMRIAGEVNAAMAMEVEQRLACNPRVERIDVEIDSHGGSVVAADKIFNALRSHGAFICVNVVGECSSSASIILMAGDWREAEGNATFLLHAPTVDPEAPKPGVRWTAQRYRQKANYLEGLTKRLVDRYSRRAGGLRDFFEREVRTETPLSLEQALKVGLIHARAGEAEWRMGRPYVYRR